MNKRALQLPGERLLRRQFRDFPLRLADPHFLLKGKVMRPQLAEAKWTFAEFLTFVRSIPCVARAEHIATLTKTGGLAPEGLLGRIDLDGAFEALRKAWGPPKKARLVRIALLGCSGFVPNA